MFKLNPKFRNIFTPFVIGLAVVACDQKEMEELSPAEAISAQSTSMATSANLIYEETAENSILFPRKTSTINGTHGIENCGTDWTLSAVTSPAFQGSKAARFEIRQGQPLVGSGEKIRSEVTIIKGTEDSRFTRDIWYSFSVYFPSVGFEADDTRDCINQWYEDGSDETTIRAEKDKVFLEVTPPSGSSKLMRYDLFGSKSGTDSGVLADFTRIPKDQWNEFTFHFVHSTGSDGLIEVFRNGVKIHHITGRNMHKHFPKWKIGLYKSSFLSGDSKHKSRVIFFDNIRVGKTAAKLSDMVSGVSTDTGSDTGADTGSDAGTDTGSDAGTDTGSDAGADTGSDAGADTGSDAGEITGSNTGIDSGSTDSGTQQIVSFTLIDSSTDKDIMTINNGASISLSALKVKKINIRANTASSDATVVSFALSGAESDSRIDDVAPYALAGDDRKGDYHNWTPTLGSYTLKATPHAGTKKKMGAATGPTYSINFTIKK